MGLAKRQAWTKRNHPVINASTRKPETGGDDSLTVNTKHCSTHNKGGNNMKSAKDLYNDNYDFIQDMIKMNKSVDYIATAICEDIPDNDEGNKIYYELCEYIEDDINILKSL